MARLFRLVLVLCACAALVGCGAPASTAPITGSIALDSTAPSTSGTPSPSTDGGITVTPMADLSAFPSAQIGDAIAGGPGFLVVGYTARPDNGVDGSVWTSDDGLTWTKGATQEGFANKLLTDLVAVPAGFVAGGQECPPTGGGECGGLDLWTSPDGVAWTPSTFAVARDAECCDLEGLAAGGPGVVGVGSDFSDVSSGPKDAMSLTSADGRTWTVHRRDPAFTDASASSVTAGGPGLVAVGGRADGTFAAWTSADGKTWMSAVPPGGGVPTGVARDVVHAGPGFVAVGKDGADAAVWTSVDGVAWVRVPSSDALKGGAMNRVTVAGDALVAVGKAGLGAAVWTSPDGTAWTRLADQDSFDGTEMTSVAASGKTLVIFGKQPTGAMPAWSGTLP